MTDHLTALLATEDSVDQVLARGVLQGILKAIKEKIEELLSVLLLSCVGGLTIELLEREAEVHWVELVTL